MLRADTALRIFNGGDTCEVEIPAWVNLQLEEKTNADWNAAFDTDFRHNVGHGSTAGFVVSVRPGQHS